MKKPRILSSVVIYLLLLAGALITLMPLVFSIMTSLRTERSLVLDGALTLPDEITFDNYTRLFTDYDFIVPLAVTLQVVAVITDRKSVV